jgi:hypothetical protein
LLLSNDPQETSLPLFYLIVFPFLVQECLVVLSLSFSILSWSLVYLPMVPCPETSLLLLPLGQLLLQ